MQCTPGRLSQKPAGHFQNNHVVPGSKTGVPADTKTMATAANARLSQHKRLRNSTMISGTPTFRGASGYGEQRTSWSAHKAVTTDKNGNTRVQHGPIKGTTGPNGTVAHYEGVDRAAQGRSMAAGAALQAATHVADHHIFKDGKTNSANAITAHAAANGSGGSALAEAAAARSGTQQANLGVKAHASAVGAKAEARSKGIPGTGDLCAAFAGVEAATANTSAEASVLGARASADATLARVQAGFAGTPICLAAEGPGAGVSAGVHASQIGAAVGAHAGEVSAGPFAARAGVKFGGGIENGCPVVHMGPVSTPCSVM